MRIFLAGATGALGRRLVPLLTQAGHQVTGSTRTPDKQDQLRAAGVAPVVVDALDRDAVISAVTDAKPDVVVHQLTALAGNPDLKHFDRYFAQTNRLRVKGTDHLLAAAAIAGARRFVAQSYTGWPNARTGGMIKTEADALDAHPVAATRESLAAIRHVETVVPAGPTAGIVLRYGAFYGPGTATGVGGEMYEMVRTRRLPVVGGGTGVFSHIHVDDAATATLLAITSDATGVFNIVDDEPATVAEWLPYMADAIGAKPPLRLPAWMVRPLLGENGVAMMTQSRGSSNAKAKRELQWTLRYPSWRQGFRTGLAPRAS